MRLWVVAYESLKTMRKSSWVIPKVVAVAYGNGRLLELKDVHAKIFWYWFFSANLPLKDDELVMSEM